jgi:hypothetical protein
MPFHIPPHATSIPFAYARASRQSPVGDPGFHCRRDGLRCSHARVARPGYRVGVDVAGTFTDLVLVRDGAAGVSPTLEGFECLGARPHRVSNAIGASLEGQPLQYVVDAMVQATELGHTIGRTRSEKPVYSADHSVYTSTGMDPRAARRGYFRDWTKQDHLDATRLHADARDAHGIRFADRAVRVIKRHGEFPAAERGPLRMLRRLQIAHTEAAKLHYKLAGKRAPFRTSEFVPRYLPIRGGAPPEGLPPPAARAAATRVA